MVDADFQHPDSVVLQIELFVQCFFSSFTEWPKFSYLTSCPICEAHHMNPSHLFQEFPIYLRKIHHFSRFLIPRLSLFLGSLQSP